jgi:hypothetical protein
LFKLANASEDEGGRLQVVVASTNRNLERDRAGPAFAAEAKIVDSVSKGSCGLLHAYEL